MRKPYGSYSVSELKVDSYLVGRHQRLSGEDGRGFLDTLMGELVARNGLVERADNGVGVWGEFAKAHELGKQGYYGPENQVLVDELRGDGLKLEDIDEYDQDGTLIAGPSFEPAEDLDYSDGTESDDSDGDEY